MIYYYFVGFKFYRSKVIENLRHIAHAPSVPLQDIPRDIEYEQEEEDPDVRISRILLSY